MYSDLMDSIGFLGGYDKEVADAMGLELKRQKRNLELIASENIISPAVMAAMGSVLTNKYAEGYPGKRYYGGCENVDIVENIAIERAKKLFGAKFANVQAHSGAQANTAVYVAILQPGDTVMGMSLAHGGHLTHGSPVNISGKIYNFVPYGTNDDGFIDYEELYKQANKCKPKLIVAGASAYPRAIDFEKLSAIARAVGAYLMVDMAHIAGLVAAGQHQSPVPYADIVTTTTHKTLRGPRGGLILTNNEYLAKKINSAIFPGTQGGPLSRRRLFASARRLSLNLRLTASRLSRTQRFSLIRFLKKALTLFPAVRITTLCLLTSVRLISRARSLKPTLTRFISPSIRTLSPTTRRSPRLQAA